MELMKKYFENLGHCDNSIDRFNRLDSRFYGPGGGSSSQSNPSTNEYSDSYNKIVTSNLGSGATGVTTGDFSGGTLSNLNVGSGGLGLSTGDISGGSLGSVDYSSGSDNTSSTYNLGAGSTSNTGGTGNAANPLAGIDPTYLIIAAIAVAAIFIFKK